MARRSDNETELGFVTVIIGERTIIENYHPQVILLDSLKNQSPSFQLPYPVDQFVEKLNMLAGERHSRDLD